MNQELGIRNKIQKNHASCPACRSYAAKGFTLVEMLLFMVIFSGLLLMLTNVFSVSLDVQKESEATSSVQQDGTYILSRLAYDIGRAQSIDTPTSLGNQTNTLVLVIGGITNTYTIISNNLTLNNTILLNGFDTTVSNLTFTRLGNTDGKNSIQIKFTITSKVLRPNGYEVRNYQTTAGLR